MDHPYEIYDGVYGQIPPIYEHDVAVQPFEFVGIYHARPKHLMYRIGKGRKKWLGYDEIMALPKDD